MIMRRPNIFEAKNGAADLPRLSCPLIELKFDAGTDPEQMSFSGYGAVFGNVDSYGDVIAKGAFKNTIREAKASGIWPAMLLQHGAWQMTADDMTPIGVWTELSEDDVGLKVEGILAPTSRGRDLYTLMKMKPRPAITGLSIGYRPVKWKMSEKPGDPRRTLTEVGLREISPVTFPANVKARVQATKGAHGIRLAEQALRDAGFSATEAKAILASGFHSQPRPRDVGGLGEIAAALRQSGFGS
jgi:uncharacterized protein